MENASKALLMAGTLLISLVIITALIFVFRNISNFQRASETTLSEEQVNEFNRSFTSFEKDLYGSELLSLINKAVEYNEKNTQEGYVPITIVVNVKIGTGYDNTTSLVQSGTYSINSKDSNIVSRNLLDDIEAIKIKYKGDKYLQRLVSLESSGKTDEITRLLEDIDLQYNSTAKKDITKYSEYMEFKRKKFRYKNTLFDGEQSGATISNTNGRIVQMEYEEITG